MTTKVRMSQNKAKAKLLNTNETTQSETNLCINLVLFLWIHCITSSYNVLYDTIQHTNNCPNGVLTFYFKISIHDDFQHASNEYPGA